MTDLGEFLLIEHLRNIVENDHPDVIVGIGDDTAVLAQEGNEYLLATVDSHVENIHYLPYLNTPRQLGRRILAVNISDIAAMGGYPQFALVSVSLPPHTTIQWFEELYRGIRAEADRFGVIIVGGNTTNSHAGVRIDITLLGRVHHDHLLLRSGASPGDKILVTGVPGQAYAGLQLVFQPQLAIDPAIRSRLIQHYIEPQPMVAEAALIAKSGLATAMIDVSDGLSGDLGHICERSKVGVRIWTEQLPCTDDVRQVADMLDMLPWQIALTGGDDYGLCFTAAPESAEQLAADITEQTGTRVSIIGEIAPLEKGRRLVLADGERIPLASQAWQHFGGNGE